MNHKAKIIFGTDGWRSRMDSDFNIDNVRIVAQAITYYLIDSGYNKGIFIGYDGRKNSQIFAKACAEVISSFNIPSFIPPRPVPTPLAAFTTVKYSLDGSIMITASHNPPIYNGIKFIPYYGGPATTTITNKIENYIQKIKYVKYEDFDKLKTKGLITIINPVYDYIDHLLNMLSVNKLKMNICIDAMHGATAGIIELLISKLNANIHMIRGNIDPEFGGTTPDPIPSNLELLRNEVISKKFDIGLAFDGDGDRLAVITNDGTFLLANQILPLLYIHLHDNRNKIGDAARTIATSHMLDFIVKERGHKVIETPVGFKHIAPLLYEKKVIIGGEESGGIGFIDHIPEKDGLASAILLLEFLSFSDIKEVIKDINSKYGYFEFKRIDVNKTINIPSDLPTKEIFNKKVIEVNKIDGLKVILEDGSWFLIRKSGTENLVRIYIESNTKDNIRKLEDFIKKFLNFSIGSLL
jgi:phosphomannomutase